MGVKDRVTIELYVDDSGTLKIVQCTKAVQDLGAAGKQSMSDSAGAADDFAGALVRQLGIYALAIGAAWKLEQAIVGGFKAGIQNIDDYRLNTIGVAATLTDIGIDQSNLQKNYSQNIAYSKDMYNELELAAARHFASGKEGVQAWNILTQKGIVLRKEEIDDLFIIVDKIKLATAGQTQGIQISQELRAMLSGQARATDQLAMMVKDRYGSAWEEVINKHRRAGDLIKWLAGEFKGLQYASQDVQGTLLSQKTTLDTLLGQVGRAGLTGLYEDIVGVLRQGNDYLREHREEIGGGIQRGWVAVKDLAAGVYEIINAIATFQNLVFTWEIKITSSILGPAAAFLSGGGEGGTYGVTTKNWPWSKEQTTMVDIPPTADFGLGGDWGNIVREKLDNQQQQTQEGIKKYFKNTTETFLTEQNQQNQALASMARRRLPEIAAIPDRSYETGVLRFAQIGREGLGVEGLPDYMRTGLPQTKPFAPDAGAGGGKGADSALNSMQTLMDRLQQDISRLSEGGRAAVDAWALHMINDINKLVAKGADGAEALTLVERAKGLKIQAINDEIYQHIAGQSGIAYAAIEADSNKWLQKAGGDIKQIMALWDIKSRKEWEADVKNYTERLNLEKGMVDQAAQLSPLWQDQVAWKRKALELDIEAHRYAEALKLNKLELAGIITKAQADEYRGRQALLDQQKRFNFEMENNKGLAGWAWGRGKEEDQRNSLKEMMGGLESGFQNAFSSGLQGVLAHDQQSLKKIGATMFQGLLGEINKASITTLFGKGAQLLRPQGPQGLTGAGGRAGGGGDPYGLTKAGQTLQQAGLGFNLPTAQLGLAGGGLLLAGLGIMTNSQALVYAGMILQVAAMAIQLYEALTSTTVMGEMTFAAGALNTSAVALNSAAMALSSAAAALGGSSGGGFLSSIGGIFGAIGGALLAPFTGGASLFLEPAIMGGGALFGGMMGMHSGLIVAHDGLNLRSNERLAKLLVDEWVLNPDATAQLSRIPGAFDMLNSGRLPAVPVPMGNYTTPARQSREGAGGDTHYHQEKISPTIIVQGDITPAQADDLWRRVLEPSYQRQKSRFVKPR